MLLWNHRFIAIFPLDCLEKILQVLNRDDSKSTTCLIKDIVQTE